jgi:hypothetical protein
VNSGIFRKNVTTLTTTPSWNFRPNQGTMEIVNHGDTIDKMNEISTPHISIPSSSNLPLSRRDVINYMKHQIAEMRSSGNSLRVPFTADEIASIGENLSIRQNAKTHKFLIKLFPPNSIPQKKQRRSEGERKTFKQKYDPDQVEMKRYLLTLALNICWNQALSSELTDELRATLFCPDNGPIDFIIYILCECAKEIENELWSETLQFFANLDETTPHPYKEYDDVSVSSLSWGSESGQPSSSEHSSTGMNPRTDESLIDQRIDIIESKVEEVKSIVEDLEARISSLTILTSTNGPGVPNNSTPYETLGEMILDLLRQERRLKACHIATKLNADKAVINKILYHELEGQVCHHEDTTWSLAMSPTIPVLMSPTIPVSTAFAPPPIPTIHSEIESFLCENPKSDALAIARALCRERKEINQTLSSLEKNGRVTQLPPQSSASSRPLWSLSNKRMRGDDNF